jgi:hypothetical protein
VASAEGRCSRAVVIKGFFAIPVITHIWCHSHWRGRKPLSELLGIANNEGYTDLNWECGVTGVIERTA